MRPCKTPRQRIGKVLKDGKTKKCELSCEILKHPLKSRRSECVEYGKAHLTKHRPAPKRSKAPETREVITQKITKILKKVPELPKRVKRVIKPKWDKHNWDHQDDVKQLYRDITKRSPGAESWGGIQADRYLTAYKNKFSNPKEIEKWGRDFQDKFYGIAKEQIESKKQQKKKDNLIKKKYAEEDQIEFDENKKYEPNEGYFTGEQFKTKLDKLKKEGKFGNMDFSNWNKLYKIARKEDNRFPPYPNIKYYGSLYDKYIPYSIKARRNVFSFV